MPATSCCASGLPTDEGVIARKITTTNRILCASPSYLARRGAPRSPEDLTAHSCLRLTRPAPAARSLALHA